MHFADRFQVILFIFLGKIIGSSTYCMDLNHDQTLHILMLPTAFSASIVTSNSSWKKFLTPGLKQALSQGARQEEKINMHIHRAGVYG